MAFKELLGSQWLSSELRELIARKSCVKCQMRMDIEHTMQQVNTSASWKPWEPGTARSWCLGTLLLNLVLRARLLRECVKWRGTLNINYNRRNIIIEILKHINYNCSVNTIYCCTLRVIFSNVSITPRQRYTIYTLESMLIYKAQSSFEHS
jgi:hypothetical protein